MTFPPLRFTEYMFVLQHQVQNIENDFSCFPILNRKGCMSCCRECILSTEPGENLPGYTEASSPCHLSVCSAWTGAFLTAVNLQVSPLLYLLPLKSPQMVIFLNQKAFKQFQRSTHTRRCREYLSVGESLKKIKREQRLCLILLVLTVYILLHCAATNNQIIVTYASVAPPTYALPCLNICYMHAAVAGVSLCLINVHYLVVMQHALMVLTNARVSWKKKPTASDWQRERVLFLSDVSPFVHSLGSERLLSVVRQLSFFSFLFYLQVPRCVFKTSCVAPEVRTLCKIHRTCVYRCKKKDIYWMRVLLEVCFWKNDRLK